MVINKIIFWYPVVGESCVFVHNTIYFFLSGVTSEALSIRWDEIWAFREYRLCTVCNEEGVGPVL